VTEEAGPLAYVGEHVQIGTGFAGMRVLAQNGQVLVGNGELRLVGTRGQLIARGDIAGVTVARGKGLLVGIAWVSIEGTRYSVAIGAGGLWLLTGLLRLVKGASGGKRLIAAVAAEQARSATRP
jgi:hypothetical protein